MKMDKQEFALLGLKVTRAIRFLSLIKRENEKIIEQCEKSNPLFVYESEEEMQIRVNQHEASEAISAIMKLYSILDHEMRNAHE